MGTTKPWQLALAVTATVSLVLVAAVALYPFIQIAVHERPFDSVSWRTAGHAPTTSWPMRLRMVDDLTARQQLIGLSRPELVALLGRPDAVTLFQERSRRADNAIWDVAYELGPERGPIIRIDNDWLLFDLDNTGKVRRFIVTHD